MARSSSSRKGSVRSSPARSSTRTARAGAKRGRGFPSSPWLSDSAGCGDRLRPLDDNQPFAAGLADREDRILPCDCVNTGSTVYGGGGSGEPTTRDVVQRGAATYGLFVLAKHLAC